MSSQIDRTRARQSLADALTAVLKATADAIEAEQQILVAESPEMRHFPQVWQVDPELIRDLTKAPCYRVMLDDFVASRIAGHPLFRLVSLLERLAPAAFNTWTTTVNSKGACNSTPEERA